ncbi:winged helix-turn-helix domain-containing protein [Winslowiella toletana]|uniref:winged helix-turn-helix domain-containing protein n=1 Tax=Winslowiella toletana TaxID=92490 RepID=UPI0028BD751F|nr:hypothetical protein [Winslowiella toletana]WNN46708.1 hypothetical protein RIN69_22535 [Winslowiella toletana]
MRYVLGNALIFDDIAGTLTGIASEKNARLPYAAVLLLKVFCENPHALLGRGDLMDRAWTENGLRASGSNLYNSLSLIRKTVEMLDVDLHIIRTQPKVGLVLEVDVIILDDPDSGPVSSPDGEAVPEPELFTTHQGTAQPAESTRRNFRNIPLLYKNFYLFWTLLIAALLIAVHFTKLQHAAEDKSGRQYYYKLGALQQCSLFRFNEPDEHYSDSSMEKTISLLAEKYNIDCRNRKADFFVYSTENTHNSYSSTAQLNIICLINKKNNMAIDCSNYFLQKRKF